MPPKSINAYDVSQRVARYDRDMDVMHPLRHKMFDVALEVLPISRESEFTAIELGMGTGTLSQRVLEQYPKARLVAIDGADSMLDLAKLRLAGLADRVTFVRGDFRDLDGLLAGVGPAALVISAYALHHLDGEEKEATVRRALQALEPQGWFLNADLVATERKDVRRLVQDIRISGILERAEADDARFRDRATTAHFLDELEAAEADQPLTLAEELRVVRRAGLREVEVFWKEYREVVYGGPRS